MGAFHKTKSPLLEAMDFVGDVPGLKELLRESPADFFAGEVWAALRDEIPLYFQPAESEELLAYARQCEVCE